MDQRLGRDGDDLYHFYRLLLPHVSASTGNVNPMAPNTGMCSTECCYIRSSAAGLSKRTRGEPAALSLT